MNTQMPREMIEATRLTRAGRLSEATLLIQRMLRGEAPAQDQDDAAARPGAETIDLVPDHVHIADIVDKGEPQTRARPSAGFRTFLQRMRNRSPERSVPPADDAATPGDFTTRTYSSAAGSRAYKLYVPSTYHGQPVPLIVMLHGCTQSPDDFAAGTRMNALAEEHTFLVAYPAQPQSANPSKCWNWFSPADQQRGAGEPSLIAGITREVIRDYAVDPRRVYVAGLSAGGAAAAIMGLAYPDLYAAIGVHSGLACGAARDLPSAFAAMRQGASGSARPPTAASDDRRPIPTIVFHGDADRTVHPRNGDDVLRQFEMLARGGLQRSTERGQVPGGHRYTRTCHAEACGRVVLEQWVVHGAGHAWSGGSSAGSYTDMKGPDAARAMLRFFREHANERAC